jgi:alkylhydroperoxidase/carboxymuconolactone decarboxylase family protein YurZ
MALPWRRGAALQGETTVGDGSTEPGYTPHIYQRVRHDLPDVVEAYEGLAARVRVAGPLGPREQRLVKLGIATGLASEGAVRSHVRRGLAEGLTREELLHAIVLAIPTAGFPASVAAYGWALEVLDAEENAG